jgi:hypothetical protein
MGANGKNQRRQQRPAAPAFEFDVFLCHSSRDNRQVERLATRLSTGGLRVWFDGWEIKGGHDIFAKIEEGLTRSRCLVLVVSAAALASEWVRLESNTALFRDPLNKGRRFIPVLLDDCRDQIPDTLRRYRFIDLRRLTRAALKELTEAVTDEPARGRGPAVWPSAVAGGRR